MEDSLMAGGMVHRLKNDFTMACDSSKMMEQLYGLAKNDLYEFHRQANHFGRLQALGAQFDVEFCLSENKTSVVPVFENNALIKK